LTNGLAYLLLAFVVVLSISAKAQTSYVHKGIIDLRQWDFNKQGNVSLDGEWEFYMSEFIAPEKFSTSINSPIDYITFPSTWNHVSRSLRPGFGFATYHVRILISTPQTLALELPHFYSSYKLWINQEFIAGDGDVGTSEQTSKPAWESQTVMFTPSSDILDVVIHVSNFHHTKGGVRRSLLIGNPDNLNYKRAIAVNSNIMLFGGLILTSLVFAAIFLFVRHERSVAYFAILCFTWALRSVFSNLNIAITFFPEIPWELCVKIEYITLYLTMIWAILFLAALFPEDVNSLFKYFLCICNIIFILFTAFSKAAFYTQFLPVYLSFCLILLLYIVYVMISAVVNERSGVWLIVSCIMMGVVVFAYDLIAYQGMATFNAAIINIGYFIMFLLMAACLVYQLGFFKRAPHQRNILTYEDLYGSDRK
jgi:hypothetical protein